MRRLPKLNLNTAFAKTTAAVALTIALASCASIPTPLQKRCPSNWNTDVIGH